MRRLLVLVSAIVLVESTFFSVLAPLLPQYADEFGLSATALGILSAAYAAGALAAALPSGLIAVRMGVRPTVLAGLAIIVGTSIAFGLADSDTPAQVSGFTFVQDANDDTTFDPLLQ